MINPALSSDELLRYSRQINLKEIGLSGQESLKNARVLCIGLGGLGSSLLLYLAAAGVGRLGLVDCDTVELSNLQRQVLYRLSQVSFAKTASASAQILELNPNTQVDAYCEKFTERNATHLISQYDIVADCSDNFHTNYLIHDVCFSQRKPYIYASVSQFQGYCSVFHGKEGPCLRCLFPTPPDPKFAPSCNENGILGVVPGILGTIQATEIIKWVLGIGHSLRKRLLVADFLKMTFREIQLFQNPDCQLCVHNQSLHNPLSSPPADEVNLTDYAITAEELQRLLKHPGVTLVDVRSTKEHEVQNIGGKLLPFAELSGRLTELNPNHTIILYCHSGIRSINALNLLLNAGFSSVKYLIGGISAIEGKKKERLAAFKGNAILG
ncbi:MULTISPECIES: molybdopterin-synthase adenylyltransferase MoeB [Legionella]|uniref:Molybdopterin-synthase adenylyltransferase n=1 Tax=Legionella maceachernii TaxID=466 RepID=A0A0W0VVI3_9GAMM|nr:molybdopterin-synthase adenylyltransferase MoeB [Legionella maceachernii]KTD24034.1 sulfurylase ThiF [Legionella maceachernii]SJZ84521.1 adenylyltransferase and sulfurtransferase [Legionella maceachernii]SUO99287.1 Probable adenylyltransferase/sulfurtransferase MoeZ [Legionella maceachernii]